MTCTFMKRRKWYNRIKFTWYIESFCKLIEIGEWMDFSISYLVFYLAFFVFSIMFIWVARVMWTLALEHTVWSAEYMKISSKLFQEIQGKYFVISTVFGAALKLFAITHIHIGVNDKLFPWLNNLFSFNNPQAFVLHLKHISCSSISTA